MSLNLHQLHYRREECTGHAPVGVGVLLRDVCTLEQSGESLVHCGLVQVVQHVVRQLRGSQ